MARSITPVLLSLFLVQFTWAGPTLDAVVMGNAQFSRNFYKALAKTEGNLVASPLGCLIGLAMTQAGAKGQTAVELSNGLHVQGDQEPTSNGFIDLIQKLTSSSRVELVIANKIYVKQNFALLPEFTSALTNSFHASAENVNFVDPGTTGLINKWAEDQTKEKIKNIIKPGSFNDMTRLVLINAVYFKGPWLYPFNKALTRDRDFFTDETNKIQVPFMHHNKQLGYANLIDLDAQILEIPYKGHELSLVIILPNKKTGLAALEKKLETTNLSELIEGLLRMNVMLYLPKFKVESALDLEPQLKSMGFGNMFSTEADFSGISTAGPLRISKIVQKLFIEVSEEGSDVAAATVGSPAGSRPNSPQNFQIFECNRPFRYFLTDRRQLDIIGGRVSNPAA